MMAIYDRKLSRWPVPVESVYLKTQYGASHVIVSGDPGNPPLVLLPGLAVTAMMWLPNIAALSRHFHCFALDVIGDYGKSQLTHPRYYPRSGKDYSIWLRQMYEGLGITEACLVGASNGGFVAISHALYAPEQVSKLFLMAPSGIEVTLKKVLPRIFYYLIFPTEENRQTLIHWFLGKDQNVQDAFYQQMWLAMQGLPKVPIPILISSNRLKRIKMPVMLIMGENDPTVSAVKAVQRFKDHIPQAKTILIPEVGHVLNYVAGEQVEELIIEFLGTN